MTVAEPANKLPRGVWRRFMAWSARLRFGRYLALSLAVAAMVAGISTYVLLTQAAFQLDADWVLILLNIDLVILLLLGIVIARHMVKIWSDRRRGSAGSRLHVRLALLFGLISGAPAIIMAVFSILFFNFGIESWFSDRVRTALSASEAVADAYVAEHKSNIVADALRMARDLDRQAGTLAFNQARLIKVVNLQARIRQLTEAVVFTGDGKVIARSGLTGALEFEPVPPDAFRRAQEGEVAVLTSANENRVRALLRLTSFIDTYLYVGRFVDATVLGYSQRTRGAVDQFESLEINRAELQVSFAMIFVVIALLLLLAAVWVGLNVATSMSAPVSALISATEKVRAGNLSTRVAVSGPDSDEIGVLGRAFNRMTSDLEGNRRELIEANEQIDGRRQFTETVLSGISAGVIGLDANGRITLPNSASSELLGMELEQFQGEPLDEVVPEFSGLVAETRNRSAKRPLEKQIVIGRGADMRTLRVRVGAVRADDEITGFVVTFDDVSDLLSAQRKAAWADVARRIAHEIKNPLTPIQLSAERLRRRYLKQITDDQQVFQSCIDTIIRQVESIGQMVDEFSNFARMPSPVFRHENLSDLCRQAVFLHRGSHPHIVYEADIPEPALYASCDGRQISQAITNLLLNAAEAIEGRPGTDVPAGRIVLRLCLDGGEITVIVEDNGVGLPVNDRDSLTEPYVTSREAGTGLGLAIVRKIMEDHKGRLLLEDADSGGARVSLVLPEHAMESDSAMPKNGERDEIYGA
jgi:two-component system nitrogen regulation sensor histidine kinase NtrY